MSNEKKTVSEQWFDTNCVDNADELIEIGDIARELIHQNISLDIQNSKTVIAMYSIILSEFFKTIADKEDEYDEYCLSIADRVKIGYTNTDNDDEEKVGNFSPFMQHCDEPCSDAPIDDGEVRTIELCVQWNAANVKDQSDVLKDCAARAKKALADLLNIKTDSHEFILPMFCIIHRAIVNYVKDPLKDENCNENQITVAGLYDIGAQKVDGEIHIWYQTGVPIRRWIKNDSIATGKHEDE